MIDIHSNILRGLDDGAQCLEDLIGMVKLAAEDGTPEVVAMPHDDLPSRLDEAYPAVARRCGAETAEIVIVFNPKRRCREGRSRAEFRNASRGIA